MMNKKILLLFLVFLSIGLTAGAQKKRRVKKPAEPVLTEAELAYQQKVSVMLAGARKVVVFDSLVVDKKDFYRQYVLSEDAGRIVSSAEFAQQIPDSVEATAFISSIGSTAIAACPNGEGKLRLCAFDHIGNEWVMTDTLSGFEEFDEVNHPFLMPDGQTLFFAGKSDKTLGGYDLFVTRRNSGTDTHFLHAEDMNMPFDSAEDDLLLAVDEMGQLGVFASARRQPAGKVCLYWFIPSASYPTLGDELEEVVRKDLADLNGIGKTQTDAQAVSQARAAKQNLVDERLSTKKELLSTFRFVVNDGKVVREIAGFKNSASRELAQTWWHNTLQMQKMTQQLGDLREVYATAASAQAKERAGGEILSVESLVRNLREETETLAKRIRALENE